MSEGPSTQTPAQLTRASSRPNRSTADETAREVTEQLIRDAGYDPMYAGGLDKSRALEDFLGVLFALSQTSGPVFYRFAPPEEL